METDRIKYFCAIAETGSLVAAAQILNVSHSGLSKAMGVLQNELGLTLLRPQGRGLELTEDGHKVYQKSKKLLEALTDLTRQEPKSVIKPVKIGMSEALAIHLSGPIASALKAQGMSVDIYELDSGEAEVRLAAGEIDFAFTFVPFPKNDLVYLKIKKIQMGVFFKNKNFATMPLAEIPFVVPNADIKNNPLSLKSRDGWPNEELRLAEYGAGSLSIALSLVDAGMAAVFMPRYLGEYKYAEVELKRSVFQKTDRDLFLVKKKNAEETKAMKIAARVMRTQLETR